MTDHVITNAHVVVSSAVQLQRSRNFDIDDAGRIIVKNHHPEFKERLLSVLLDETLPFLESNNI